MDQKSKIDTPFNGGAQTQLDRKIRLQGLAAGLLGIIFFVFSFLSPYLTIKRGGTQISYSRSNGVISITAIVYGAILTLSGIKGRIFFNKYIFSKPLRVGLFFLLLTFALYSLGVMIDRVFRDAGYEVANQFIGP